jgi:hypothetical protein
LTSVADAPQGTAAAQRVLEIARTDDFAVTGKGDHPAWAKVERSPLHLIEPVEHSEPYATWFKALWSPTGVYFLIDCGDRRLTVTSKGDMADLWCEDVVEVFIWPDKSVPLYLEYELSPLGSELVLLVNNPGNEFSAWTPFHYAGAKRVRKAIDVRGGPARSKAAVTGWSAEFFIPSALMHPIPNTALKPGVTWYANVYRIDYDMRPRGLFAYKNVGPSFHNPGQFPAMRFV